MLDPPDAEPFWLGASRAIDIPCPAETVRLSYTGTGLLHRDGRNQVSPELVELSVYGGWYPMTAIDEPFSWRLRTALPDNWVFAAVGTGDKTDPTSLDLDSEAPADVVLIASPRFVDRKTAVSGSNTRVLIAADAPSAALQMANALAVEAADMSAWLEGLLGPARDGLTVQPELIFTPRGGPLSYSRLPLIVTPQSSLLEQGDRPLALNIRHEVAHFWSRSKGVENDWINEGMAEYLALLRTRDREGEGPYRDRLALYREEVSRAGRGVSIVDTQSDPSRAYTNRYQRPSLLLDAAERSVGRPLVERFIARLFEADVDQTADRFTAIAVDVLGPAQANRISACLVANDWPIQCGGS